MTGFRAPFFSLIPSTVWATDILADLGFVYSSSVLPGEHPLCGFPGAPRQPFRWQNGLIELPCPVARIGRFALPFLGGPYLRYLPDFLVSHLMTRYSGSACLWTYCHPYDFDRTEPYVSIPGVPPAANVLLWLNRRHMLRKMNDLLRNASRRSLTNLVSRPEFHDRLPTFDPGRREITGRDSSTSRPRYHAAGRARRGAAVREHKSADSTPA